jgi:hypothetical protein
LFDDKRAIGKRTIKIATTGGRDGKRGGGERRGEERTARERGGGERGIKVPRK